MEIPHIGNAGAGGNSNKSYFIFNITEFYYIHARIISRQIIYTWQKNIWNNDILCSITLINTCTVILYNIIGTNTITKKEKQTVFNYINKTKSNSLLF